MQVTLEPLVAAEGLIAVTVETNSSAVLTSLVSSYCAQTGLKFQGSYGIYDERKRPLPLYSTISSLGIVGGQTLYIGKEDSRFSVFKQWPLTVAFAALFIGLIGILSLSLVYGLRGGEYFDDYGVVMDAGSSKTNTIVYKWRSSKYRGTGRVSQEDDCNVTGGIAKMDPMQLKPVISCAKNVTSVISDKYLSKTPLYFAATAGMRLLNLTNSSRVQAILHQLRLQLPETKLSLKNVEIISGRDEGIYGWTTVNFLLHTLEKPQNPDAWEPTTFGSLDLGGASLQIAYALPSGIDSEDVISLHLYGQKHHVFSRSNLCFGRDEAQNRYFALLLLEAKDAAHDGVLADRREDPCSPIGFEKSITYSDLFESFCSKPKNVSGIQNQTYTFVGTSDPNTCLQKVSYLLDDELCKKHNFKECFKSVSNIPRQQKFQAFGNFFFTTNKLNARNTTLESYRDASETFCKKNYTQVMDDDYGPQICFNSQYIYAVLIEGFKLNETTWENLEFVKKISGTDVGWTLGYMINATNMIPEKKTPRLISASALGVSLALFIVVILVTALFLLWTFKKNSCNNNSSAS